MNKLPKMSSKDWIIEKHISKKALPGENIISWIKWDPDLVPKQIILKLEADVNVTKVLNVSEDALHEEQFKSGKIDISSKHFQIPGFFGFTCFYNAVPETERTLNFIIDFEFDDRQESIEYSTKIIRPILEFGKSDYVISSTYESNMPALGFQLKNTGTGQFKKLTPFTKFLETSEMKIKVENKIEENLNEELIFIKTNKIETSKIIIEGKGYGMLSLGYDYEDAVGNKYKTSFANINIDISETQHLQVPIQENLSQEQKIILQAT